PAAVMPRRLGGHAVELQVDLDAFAVSSQQVEQCVVAGDEKSVAVEQDSRDGTTHQFVEQFGEAGVDGGFPAAEHHDVELAVLAGQSLVDVGQDLGDGDDAVQVGSRLGETR